MIMFRDGATIASQRGFVKRFFEIYFAYLSVDDFQEITVIRHFLRVVSAVNCIILKALLRLNLKLKTPVSITRIMLIRLISLRCLVLLPFSC